MFVVRLIIDVLQVASKTDFQSKSKIKSEISGDLIPKLVWPKFKMKSHRAPKARGLAYLHDRDT